MRGVVGIVGGGLLALVIACGGGAKSASSVGAPRATEPPAGMGVAVSPRDEIDHLDGQITAAMGQLEEPRPTPAANVCIQPPCDTQALSGAATTATAPDPTCKPGKSQTCTESCTLKTSICENAGRICTIAADLGGNDAYANEKCHSGTASCDAAKKRCCGCL